jgi:hypothetical protein
MQDIDLQIIVNLHLNRNIPIGFVQKDHLDLLFQNVKVKFLGMILGLYFR